MNPKVMCWLVLDGARHETVSRGWNVVCKKEKNEYNDSWALWLWGCDQVVSRPGYTDMMAGKCTKCSEPEIIEFEASIIEIEFVNCTLD
ncbi:hypothetical protein R6Q57_000497 [Mikania cordata]